METSLCLFLPATRDGGHRVEDCGHGEEPREDRAVHQAAVQLGRSWNMLSVQTWAGVGVVWVPVALETMR